MEAISRLFSFLWFFFSSSTFSFCSLANCFSTSWSRSVTSYYWTAPGRSCCSITFFDFFVFPFHAFHVKFIPTIYDTFFSKALDFRVCVLEKTNWKIFLVSISFFPIKQMLFSSFSICFQTISDTFGYKTFLSFKYRKFSDKQMCVKFCIDAAVPKHKHFLSL